MKQSQLFTKTSKTIPKDEVSLNAKLLIQAGFINKEMAGVYAFLPLGLRVLEKIKNIIQVEMNALGGQELQLTALQNSEVWKKTKRWNDQILDVWFKTKLKNGTQLGLATTHEEPLTKLMQRFIQSYQDLPVYAYQFQTKFRNEIRAKSGIMRTREFLMKDLYSFNANQKNLDEFYDCCAKSYHNIFNRSGIGKETYLTFASGGSFSKYSHEFQTVSEAGEDLIYIDTKKNIAINKEVYNDEVLSELKINKKNIQKTKTIEVGNIFKLGTKYSEALNLFYLNKSGKRKPVFMGSYGIGPARIMGTVVELNNDSKGIIWPETIAPFTIHLLNITQDTTGIKKAEQIYQDLTASGLEVLFDERSNVSPGAKFADADLIGCPYRLVLSKRTLDKDSIELKKRCSAKTELVKIVGLEKKFAE